MKVAYILPYLEKPSGWRNHSLAFIHAMCAHVEPLLFVAAADASIARELFPDMPVYPLPVTQQAALNTRHGLQRLLACYRTIRRARFPEVDLVHSLEAYPTGLVGHWFAQKTGCPHVITTHGSYSVVWHEHWPDRLAYERVLRQTRVVCPVSNGTADLMRKYFAKALSHTTIRTILNGNSYYLGVPREEALNRVSPLTPTILTVGDVKPRKGQHISLAAFQKVKERIPSARYWIAGSYKNNEYYRNLQQYTSAYRVEDVTFLGPVSDQELADLYRQASVFVLTPQQDGLHFEGFGLVYLEAGAYGLPVVATRSGGVPDAVKDGETGFLVDPGDTDGVAEALISLLTDPGLARMMGRFNRQWAETLTWESCASQQMQVYQEIQHQKAEDQP